MEVSVACQIQLIHRLTTHKAKDDEEIGVSTTNRKSLQTPGQTYQ